MYQMRPRRDELTELGGVGQLASSSGGSAGECVTWAAPAVPPDTGSNMSHGKKAGPYLRGPLFSLWQESTS